MVDKLASDPASSTTTSADPTSSTIRLCLVGGKRILRIALERLLAGGQVAVCRSFADDAALTEGLGAEPDGSFDVVLLILGGAGPFGSFRRIQDTLRQADRSVPMVVLSERASRGQIYAALRIGAKAYVNLDAEPADLVKAIEMASQERVYLAPDAAELLVNDVSTAIDPSGTARLPRMELSRREIEIIQLLCEGLSSKAIAKDLHISAKTVENHRYNIYRKCEVESIAGLMRHAIQQGLVSI